MLNNCFDVTLEQALEDEGWAQTVNFGTADIAEAMAAFLGSANRSSRAAEVTDRPRVARPAWGTTERRGPP